MSEATRQKEIRFGTPVDFTMRRKFRRARKLVGRVEGKRRAAELAGRYVQMRAIAKMSPQFGTFATDAESFVESLGGLVPDDELSAEYAAWLDDEVDIWNAFREAGLIDLAGDPRDVADGFRVTVADFAETNEPRSASRVTPVTGRSRDVTMDEADRAAVYRENVKRRDAGLPKMSDAERDSWILEHRRHAPSRHVTSRDEGGEGIGREGITPGGLPSVTDGDAAIVPTERFLEAHEHDQQIEAEERYLPAHQRTGGNRDGWRAEFPEAASPLHDTEHGDSTPDAIPQGAEVAMPGDALATTDDGSQPREAVNADTAA